MTRLASMSRLARGLKRRVSYSPGLSEDGHTVRTPVNPDTMRLLHIPVREVTPDDDECRRLRALGQFLARQDRWVGWFWRSEL